jgi:hypothetical protein
VCRQKYRKPNSDYGSAFMIESLTEINNTKLGVVEDGFVL